MSEEVIEKKEETKEEEQKFDNFGFEENEISINSKGGTELSKRMVAGGLDKELVDNFQVICSRVRTLNPEKIRIYWLHDLPGDPECNKLKDDVYRDKFHQLVFVSNWQYQQFQNYLNVPYDINSTVIDNPITPIEFVEKPKDKVKLIYTSTPHRGLDILVEVFDKLSQKYDHIELDVFSSYKLYGWEESDKNFEALFDKCRNHPKINYHGTKPHDEIEKALQQSHIFAYPSTWMETSCRTVLEAMSAGCVCVHPNLAALPDTTASLNMMFQGDKDKTVHAQEFYRILDFAIQQHKDPKKLDVYRKYIKNYVDFRFNPKEIYNSWKIMMETLLEKYPTVESRKVLETEGYFKYEVR